MSNKVFSRHGLTFIELLVAIAITACIGLGIYKALASGIALHRWLGSQRPHSETVIFFERFVSDIRNYCYLPESDFTGSATRVSFYVHNTEYITSLPETIHAQGDEGKAALYRVEYIFVSRQGSVKRKVYHYGSDEPRLQSTLLSGVQNLAFEFISSTDTVDDELKRFSSVDKSPTAIIIDVDVKGTDGGNDRFRRIVEIPFHTT